MIDTLRLRVHACNQQKKGIIQKTISERTNQSLMLIESHNRLYNALSNVKKKGFQTTKILSTEEIVFSDAPFEDVLSSKTSKQVNEHYIAMNKIRFTSQDKVMERNLSVKGKYRLDSSESDVTFMINYEGGFVDFEFSVPKYLYGHNLAQFVPQSRSSLAKEHSLYIKSVATQRDLLFDRLNRFIKLFFKDLWFNLNIHIDKETGELYEPNFDYIELKRVDLCYNQYFDTKEDSLLYLDSQKKFARKSKIYSPDTNMDFKTTLAYRTQNGNYFKIYHKGTEYINQKHGDFHKHQKVNDNFLHYYNKTIPKQVNIEESFDLKKKTKLFKPLTDKELETVKTLFKSDTQGKAFLLSDSEYSYFKPFIDSVHKKLPFNTKFLKNEMDKILRYEMSISGKALSYYYKNNVFRKNCKTHQRFKRIYKSVKNDLECLHTRNDQSINIPNYAMKIYKDFHKWNNRVCALTLTNKSLIINNSVNGARDYSGISDTYNIGQIYKELGLGSLLETKDTYHFNNLFLKYCVNHFFKEVERFQIKEIEPFDNLKKRVVRFNTIVENNRLNDIGIVKWNKLKESEKIKRNFKTVNYANIQQLYDLLYNEKLSLHEIREKLLLTDSQYHRRKKDLMMIGLTENHISMTKKIKTSTDFTNYYYYTSILKYSYDFFYQDSHQYQN
jgi:hypothetical protein